MRIAVDLLGGDQAPAVVVDGALLACRADPALHLLLVGPAPVAEEARAAFPAPDRARVSTRAAAGVVGMGDAPTRARHDTTVRIAAAAVSGGEADGFVSAGASGAVVTAAALALGRWTRRPALAATVPSLTGPVVLLDVGANPEPEPSVLVAHATLGAAYAAVVHGVERPRVGLLSNGAEAGRGDQVRLAAATGLAATRLPAGGRHIGNVEGHDVPLGGRADVVVTDGFTGNVLLKGIEGAYALAGGRMRTDTAPRAAALLGVGGVAVVCHGAANGADLASGIGLAAHLCRINAMARLAAAARNLVEVS
ncbi:MAG: phosphate acyltransferase PlsX [Micromonosporaceae bacterium]